MAAAPAFSIVGKWMFACFVHTTISGQTPRDPPLPLTTTITQGPSLRSTCHLAVRLLLTLNGLVWISVVIVWTSLTIRNKYYALFADYIGQLVIF